MKAILLAAGFGTRLRPLTDSIPKCLVPIKGKPLLEIWIERLQEAGINAFLVNTHYLSPQVESFIDSSKYKSQVQLVFEPELLGTAGTLSANLDYFDNEGGLFIHADNYCLADLVAFIDAHRHRPPNCLMTMMTFRTENPSSCGIVEIDAQNIVRGFHEKVASPPSNLANGAVYILSTEMLNKIIQNFSHVNDFSTGILPHFIGEIYTYETSEVFMDIGTPETYIAANNLA